MIRNAIGRTAAATVVMVALGAGPAWSQPGHGVGMGMPHYDTATEATVHGTVDHVQTQQGRRGGPGGTHLLLKTETGTVTVLLGPTNWLAEKGYVFSPGDPLTVVGSAVTVNGARAFLARQITRNGTSMTLRDQAGAPLWSGRMRPRTQ